MTYVPYSWTRHLGLVIRYRTLILEAVSENTKELNLNRTSQVFIWQPLAVRDDADLYRLSSLARGGQGFPNVFCLGDSHWFVPYRLSSP